MPNTAADPRVIWHDVECGAYAADLPLWRDLAAAAPGPVLELGSGTGRVSLHLAKSGYRVTSLDRDERLLAALRERAAARGLDVVTAAGDIREFALPGRFGLILAPMQILQLLSGRGERRAALRAAAAHLAPGGAIAAAIVEGTPAGSTEPSPDGVLPDVNEIDGWVYSSLPLEIRATGGELAVTRLRQTVSPAGDLSEEVDEIRLTIVTADDVAADAVASGLRERERRVIPTTPEHVGSTVIVLEAADG